MSGYTVHEPPPRAGEGEPAPERFAFVRDGFSFWAFLLGPVWMLWHGLWLVLIGYLVVTAVLQVVLTRIGASGGVHVAVGLLVAILLGFEAASLRRWALARRRWRNLGVVVADDLELAERRFFDAWVATAHAAQPLEPRRQPVRPGRTVPDVIGLFPEPGARP